MAAQTNRVVGFACITAGMVALLSAAASGTSIHPGETIPLFGTTSAARPEIGGPVIDQRVANFAMVVDGTSVTGAVSQRVRRLGELGGFGLVIDYRISSFDDQGLGVQIVGLQTQSYYGDDFIGPLDVDFRLDEPGAVSPFAASRIGLPVIFDFGPSPLFSGLSSRWMFVGDPNTDLVVFGRYGAQLLARDAAGHALSIPFDSYLTFVPVPASWPVVALGLASIVSNVRRVRGRE